VLLPDESAHLEIERGVTALLDRGQRPLVLGGDHSITWPVLRAVRPRHPRLSVLHLDAHPDLYDEFDGDRRSHACPFARAMEEGLADQLVQVGIRAMTGHQADQAARFGVETIDMRAWSTGRRFNLQHPVYISIDLDALDPAFAPGVSHREPGGLSVREVLALIQGISLPIVGADVVEYNPGADIEDLTAGVAAKVVKEVVAAMLRSG
jgi:agmatinase